MTTLQYTEGGQDFDVVGADDYTGDNLSKLVWKLVGRANSIDSRWKYIRVDENFDVDLHIKKPVIKNSLGEPSFGYWCSGGSGLSEVGKLDSSCGVNWRTFGIIRTAQDGEGQTVRGFGGKDVKCQATVTPDINTLGTIRTNETEIQHDKL